MGGGALRDCLMQFQSKLNSQCVADYKAVTESLAKRAAAQAAVPKVCRADARQYCNGVASGNGHFLSCLNASTRVVGATCKQALADAGWN
jgi:Cysteine rich repeat